MPPPSATPPSGRTDPIKLKAAGRSAHGGLSISQDSMELALATITFKTDLKKDGVTAGHAVWIKSLHRLYPRFLTGAARRRGVCFTLFKGVIQ